MLHSLGKGVYRCWAYQAIYSILLGTQGTRVIQPLLRFRIYAISIGRIIHRSYSPGSQCPRPGSGFRARDSLNLGGMAGEVDLIHTGNATFRGGGGIEGKTGCITGCVYLAITFQTCLKRCLAGKALMFRNRFYFLSEILTGNTCSLLYCHELWHWFPSALLQC